MSNDRKTWLIEAGDVLDVMSPDKKQPATAAVPVRPVDPPRPAPQTAVGEPAKRRAKSPAPPQSNMQFALLMALTYLLGPLAILLTPRGRKHKILVTVAALSTALTVILIVSRFDGLVRADRMDSAWLWTALVVVAAFGGFTAWTRALHLLGGEGVPHVSKLPHWLRQSWAIGALGLVAPGSGMLLSGSARRTAVSIWLFWPAVVAIVVLFNGMGLWRHHLNSGWLAASGPALETALLVAGAVVAVSFLAYIAQALEGVRQVRVEPGLQTRVKGDYYALAVVAAVVVLVVVVSPSQMAHQLHTGGEALREEGFQAIPLRLALAASQLDSGKPEYALQAMELYAELGQTEQAEALRADLDRNLSTYVALVQKETVAEYGLAQATEAARPVPAVGETTVAQVAKKPRKKAAAVVAGGLDQTQLLGSMVRKSKPAATVTDTSAVAEFPAATRSARPPLGLGLPLDDGEPAAGRDSADK